MAIQDGVYVASLSVLNKNLSVNSEQTLLHAEKIISLGATGVVLSGSTGQSQNLSFQCKMNLIDQASKSSQNQKIIIGPGTNSLLDTAKLINYAKSRMMTLQEAFDERPINEDITDIERKNKYIKKHCDLRGKKSFAEMIPITHKAITNEEFKKINTFPGFALVALKNSIRLLDLEDTYSETNKL